MGENGNGKECSSNNFFTNSSFTHADHMELQETCSKVDETLNINNLKEPNIPIQNEKKWFCLK